MTTVGDIINRAMKDAGVIAAGETAPAEDAADALAALNDIVVQWQTVQAYIPEAPYALTTFTGLADALALPAKYEPAMRYSLAEVLLTTFSLPTRGDITVLAMKARKALKRSNLVIPDAEMPGPLQFGRTLGLCGGDA